MSTSRLLTINPLYRILVLAFGGTAVLQWVHNALLGAASGDIMSEYAAWLRNATLALPFVAAAVLLAGRKSRQSNSDLPLTALYATIMGAGSLLRMASPDASHTHGVEISTWAALQHAALIMLVAGAYAALVGKVTAGLSDGPPLEGTSANYALRITHYSSRIARLSLPIAALLAIAPLFFAGSGGRAAAQTSFPEQVIHPKGSLLLIARNVEGGALAYVAPDYGANGVRPTIEMTEGETLNITLKNELKDDVSLHVHGVHYNQDSDGTRHSNSVVKPGQQKVYQWRAATGTAGYWHYHDHVMGDDEGSSGILGGLYGGLIVRKPGDPKPVKTFVIVGHDKTLNGRIFPNTPTYTAKQGELVEWIVIQHGNRTHTFHLHAHRWLTPNRTGDPNPSAPANAGSGREDNHILAPGDSFGFLIIAGEGVGPGMWMYHCHFQDHASAMKGFFKVLPASGAQTEEPPTATSRTFPETGKTVSGRFLEYWNANGGVAQQGFPISEPFMEKSETDGKTYQVQYFERAVFEMHPENQPPYDVLLSQLGTFRYKQKYPNGR